MKYTLLLFLMIPLLATNCEDDPPLSPLEQLPPATQTGEYTFGCLVNGEAFVPDNRGDIIAIYQQSVLILGGEGMNTRPGEQNISMDIRSAIKIGRSYDLTNDPYDAAGFVWYGIDIPTCRYEAENTLSGILTITHFDSLNYIVAGTFEFTTATEGCDTIRVTNGRFDIPYIP